ncbi:MAG: MFS transporter [Candidatus Pelagadaptatus aseana]|uniref:MFS transporter n=1 Tax=Candidatus Pelagadaptatus aseana TaxID=3120508 RepID=UPI0039B32173
MSKRLVAGLLLAVSLHAFDELVLVIALPNIVAELGGAQWYGLSLAAYMITSLVAVAWAGDWIDQHGPGGIFGFALLIFSVGLGLAIQAPNLQTLIAARMLQGLGGGVVWTVAYSVINRLAAVEIKSRMVAMLDSAWLLPSLLAPVVGGLLVDYLSWRWIFILQIPLVALIALLVVPQLRALDYEPQQPCYDSLKNALQIGCWSLLIFWVVSEPMGWLWLLLPVALVGIWPPLNRVMPEGWLQLRSPLAVAVVLLGLSFFAFFGMETFMPLFLIEERGFSTSKAGLLFTCAAFTWVIASFGQSWLDQRISHQRSMLIGLLLLLITLAIILLTLIPTVSPGWLYLAWCLGGFGMGLTFNAAATAAMLATRDGKEGATAAATGMAETLGIALAGGIGGGIKNQVTFQGGSLSDALLLIWLSMGAVLLFCLLIVWRRFPREKQWF